MDVGLRILRHMVVDHEIYILHVQPSRCDVGHDEDGHLVLLEIPERFEPLPLTHIPVEVACRDSLHAQPFSEHLGIPLRFDEHDRLLGFVLLDESLEHIEFLHARNLNERMVDLRDREGIGGFDERVIDSEVFLYDPLDLRSDGRGEREGLLQIRQTSPDEIDIVDEPHVKHPINLIKYENLDILDLQLLPFDEIDYPPRRSDDDVLPFFKHLDLLVDRFSAVNGERPQTHIFRDIEDLLLNLTHELPRGGENERLHPFLAQIDPFKDRNNEGCGLPGTGLRLSDDVLAVFRYGDHLLLNLGRGRIFQFIERRQNSRLQIKLFEFHRIKELEERMSPSIRIDDLQMSKYQKTVRSKAFLKVIKVISFWLTPDRKK